MGIGNERLDSSRNGVPLQSGGGTAPSLERTPEVKQDETSLMDRVSGVVDDFASAGRECLGINYWQKHGAKKGAEVFCASFGEVVKGTPFAVKAVAKPVAHAAAGIAGATFEVAAGTAQFAGRIADVAVLALKDDMRTGDEAVKLVSDLVKGMGQAAAKIGEGVVDAMVGVAEIGVMAFKAGTGQSGVAWDDVVERAARTVGDAAYTAAHGVYLAAAFEGVGAGLGRMGGAVSQTVSATSSGGAAVAMIGGVAIDMAAVAQGAGVAAGASGTAAAISFGGPLPKQEPMAAKLLGPGRPYNPSAGRPSGQASSGKSGGPRIVGKIEDGRPVPFENGAPPTGPVETPRASGGTRPKQAVLGRTRLGDGSVVGNERGGRILGSAPRLPTKAPESAPRTTAPESVPPVKTGGVRIVGKGAARPNHLEVLPTPPRGELVPKLPEGAVGRPSLMDRARGALASDAGPVTQSIDSHGSMSMTHCGPVSVLNGIATAAERAGRPLPMRRVFRDNQRLHRAVYDNGYQFQGNLLTPTKSAEVINEAFFGRKDGPIQVRELKGMGARDLAGIPSDAVVVFNDAASAHAMRVRAIAAKDRMTWMVELENTLPGHLDNLVRQQPKLAQHLRKKETLPTGVEVWEADVVADNFGLKLEGSRDIGSSLTVYTPKPGNSWTSIVSGIFDWLKSN